jgi:hypothetical protein
VPSGSGLKWVCDPGLCCSLVLPSESGSDDSGCIGRALAPTETDLCFPLEKSLPRSVVVPTCLRRKHICGGGPSRGNF